MLEQLYNPFSWGVDSFSSSSSATSSTRQEEAKPRPPSQADSPPRMMPNQYWDRYSAGGNDDNNRKRKGDPLYCHPQDTACHEETVYVYFTKVLLPAVLSALPVLVHRMVCDVGHLLTTSINGLLPQTSWRESAADLWDEAMLKRFDGDRDELLEWMRNKWPSPPSFWQWFAQEWPLMDFKVGLFLWQSFGSALVIVTLLSIVPGFLHEYSAKLLRWPILALTNFLIAVELVVYGVIRVAVRMAEFLVARPKHRALRRQMQDATSYAEWFAYASQLDRSQKRDRWLKNLDHDHARYNWTFVKDLIADLRAARAAGDSLWAMAVLENCTRKNVGGVMSEDLFSYSNTGIPKYIVTEFFNEVTQTLHWITDEACKLPHSDRGLSKQTKADRHSYEQTVKTEVRKEKDKLWRHLVSVFEKSSSNVLDDEENYEKIEREEYFQEKKQMAQKIHQQATGCIQTAESEEEGEAIKSPRKSISVPAAVPSLHRDQVMQLLRRARTAYGRTALCLSGGAMMGLYHCGHIRALLETGCLPHIISGTSAGAVIGAVLCTRTDEELLDDIRPEVIVKHMTCFARPWMVSYSEQKFNRDSISLH